MSTERPLFIPLTRRWFEAFERGEKQHELRPWGTRWNSRTCRVGRRVTLSCGYGKARRLTGTITAFATDGQAHLRYPEWAIVYGTRYSTAAVITIVLDK